MLHAVLLKYGISSESSIQPYGTGLINHTWKVEEKDQAFILQRINESVFKQPLDISSNIEQIGSFLKEHHPDYFFVHPIRSLEGGYVVEEKGWYRLFPFIKDSHSLDVVECPEQAFEAAFQFGSFTRSLSGFPLQQLAYTLPHFHDLDMRQEEFFKACDEGNPARLREAQEAIGFLKNQGHVVDRSKKIKASAGIKQRVTHHDTKISNVLFSPANKGICVIDLDTMMPGYYISDVGDMARTYLSPVSEEEQDFSKIEIREDYFRAILEGYLSAMSSELEPDELQHFTFGGSFMIYMQAVRFLTDYFNDDDRYYGALYEGHNYIRALNQITLLQRYQEKESLFTEWQSQSRIFHTVSPALNP